MKLNTKRFTFRTSALVLLLFSFGVTPTPAQAQDCPYPVADPTSNDNPTSVIRLISPVLTDDNSIHRYDYESQFTIDCDWFGVGMHFNQVYVPFGLTTNLTFHASTPAGAPLAFTKVNLRANKGYSGSNAAVRVNGVKARPAPSNAGDGANVFGTTDVNGNVTFVVQSPTDCEAYGGTLPAAPAQPNADTPMDRNGDPSTDCYSEFLPQITGEKTDAADFVELHYFDAAGLDYSTDGANIDVVSPQLGETNSILGDGLVQTYSLVGSKQTVVFQALKRDGSYARNLPVQVKINLANSGSNAKMTAGILGTNGVATALTADATKTAEDQLVLTGTTDAFGNVAFALNNIDTTGEAAPATKTSPVPATGAKFATVTASLTGVEAVAKVLEVHYYTFYALPSRPNSLQIYNLRTDGAGFVRVKISHDYKEYEGNLKFVVYRRDTGGTICEVTAKSNSLGCISRAVEYGSTYQFGVYGVNQLGEGPHRLSNVYEYRYCSSAKPSLSGYVSKYIEDPHSVALASGSVFTISGWWRNYCIRPSSFVEYREKSWNKAWSSWISVPLLPEATFTLSKSFNVNTTVQFRGLLESKYYLSPLIPVRVITKIARPISFEALIRWPAIKANLGRAVNITFNGDEVYSGVCTSTLSTAKAMDLTGKARGSEIESATFVVFEGRGSVQIPLKWVGSYNLSVVCRDPNFQDLREFAVVNVK